MNVPKLRFNEFQSQWNHKKIAEIMQKVSCPVDVELNRMYQQIGIRSHGKGLFHKEPVSGASLGNKRIFWLDENLFLVNIVFAWEQAVAKTTSFENGMVASHRFPMYKPKENLSATDYILHFFLTDKGKYYLGLASPGGAGRNKTLGQKNFEGLVLIVPEVEEQTKIANFLTAIDEKITQLTQKYDLLKQYKKGVMQQIFSQKLRFKDDDGREFPEWEELAISEIFQRSTHSSKAEYIVNDGMYIVVDMGSISRDAKLLVTKKTNFSNDFLTTSDLVMAKDDIGGGNIIGRVVQIPENRKYVCSDHVYKLTIRNGYVGYFHYAINSSKVNKSFRQKANGTAQIGISNKTVDDQLLPVPTLLEQIKIANFLTAIDDKITQTQIQLNAVKLYKKGLLQQLFV